MCSEKKVGIYVLLELPIGNLFDCVSGIDCLCGLVVRLPGCITRGPGFDSLPLPDFLSSSGSGTGSTQHREDK
jgi:hypothetical protein